MSFACNKEEKCMQQTTGFDVSKLCTLVLYILEYFAF